MLLPSLQPRATRAYFRDKMLRIFFIFEAHIFQQLRIRYDSLFQRNGPWFRVRLRVVHGNLNLQMPEVRPPEALGELSGIGKRAAVFIQPVSVPESAGRDYERIAFPLPRGLTVPGRLRIDR